MSYHYDTGNGRPERAQTQTLQPHMTVSQE